MSKKLAPLLLVLSLLLSAGIARGAPAQQSETLPAAVNNLPDPPANLSAYPVATTLANRAIVLKWDPVQGDDITYKVYRALSSPVPIDLAHLIASHLQLPHQRDSRVDWETDYFYAVTAADASGNNSAPSAEASARLMIFEDVQVAPDPFSPDDDGVDDTTTITYTLSLPPQQQGKLFVTAEILDQGGDLVRTLPLTPTMQGNGTYAVSWDGHTHTGFPDEPPRHVASGTYTYRLLARRFIPGKRISIEYTGEVTVIASPLDVRGFYPDGVIASYYNDNPPHQINAFNGPINWETFTTFVISRTETSIAFNTGITPPAPGVNGTYWSARWEGQLAVPERGVFVFYFDDLDDGGRLYLDGYLLLESWLVQSPHDYQTPPIFLPAGLYDFTVEYAQGPGDGASLYVSWSSSYFPKEIIGPVPGGQHP